MKLKHITSFVAYAGAFILAVGAVALYGLVTWDSHSRHRVLPSVFLAASVADRILNTVARWIGVVLITAILVTLVVVGARHTARQAGASSRSAYLLHALSSLLRAAVPRLLPLIVKVVRVAVVYTLALAALFACCLALAFGSQALKSISPATYHIAAVTLMVAVWVVLGLMGAFFAIFMAFGLVILFVAAGYALRVILIQVCGIIFPGQADQPVRPAPDIEGPEDWARQAAPVLRLVANFMPQADAKDWLESSVDSTWEQSAEARSKFIRNYLLHAPQTIAAMWRRKLVSRTRRIITGSRTQPRRQ